jgi:hypothetical protein
VSHKNYLVHGRTYCDELAWLDYMEGELDPNLAIDMSLLLKNSPGDRKRLDRLWRARTLVKASEYVLVPEDARVYECLHDKIMSAVEEKEIDSTPETNVKVSRTLTFDF